jgi:hypothetical protein
MALDGPAGAGLRSGFVGAGLRVCPDDWAHTQVRLYGRGRLYPELRFACRGLSVLDAFRRRARLEPCF